ncbi:CarD family transcriptional regulator [Domibacillus enclensis]|uniref:Transcription factor YdeB n=1 Tax=Domibacillus enclensis TaxID=1017273 RepID=A0A1N6Y6U7_9BACI|nr:CarD family transcriptional regulator [Domibacillus enclensis]OXS77536.1 transcription factor YdeB [Domibacillus enclensis]SIR10246.1 transcriptional regulator, CarD family [Domibacillus enclensis]
MEVEHLFEVGDKVVYPMHGAGVIKAIEEKELFGKKQSFLIMAFPVKNIQVMIPISKIDHSGMRLVLEQSAMEQVIYTVQRGDMDQSLDYKQRFKQNTEKMKTGETSAGAEVIRDLMIVKQVKPLNSNEKTMLREAMQFLISEIEMSNSLTEQQASDLFNEHFKAEKIG